MKQIVKVGTLPLLFLACALSRGGQVAGPSPGGAPGASPPVAVSTFKVAVNVLFEEVRVLNEHGRPIDNLKAEDFLIFEDGAEQKITYFYHEKFPLAIALVVDNSSSVSAELDELRRGALDTLAQLKPDDEVAIFSFSEKPEMVEGLTRNRGAVAEDLWALSPYGGTDINAAIYEAALYLGRAPRDRRRAIILVSDNEPADDHVRTVKDVTRAALQSSTAVYSIKVGNLRHSRGFMLKHAEAPFHDVEKICRESGGELIDTRSGVSVTGAMKTIFNWLKEGYTIGYTPTNLGQNGAYRSIDVRLSERSEARREKYAISARKGYYAPMAHENVGPPASGN